ncbi:hypothetical protein DVH24_004987 [Malus domestica]|uniref:Uncharacterized protein n=1 Tax=Malus domestica TaxID=3750 RepID=A0A498IIL5_MALDO|nr:hypothetical protein DVH24_004987 [Malus domestica]
MEVIQYGAEDKVDYSLKNLRPNRRKVPNKSDMLYIEIHGRIYVVPRPLVLCINIWRRLWESIRKVVSVLFHFFTSAVNLQKPKNQTPAQSLQDPGLPLQLPVTVAAMETQSQPLSLYHTNSLSISTSCNFDPNSIPESAAESLLDLNPLSPPPPPPP